jgi:phage/plasmid-like protein (TIGR03299 family)
MMMTSTLDQTFTSRVVPWARVGHVIDEPDVDAATAARLGGLDFDVELRRGGFEDPTSPTGWRSVPTRHAVVRTDTQHFFSYVSSDYKVVQYRDAFAFMDGVNPRYVAAGTLSGGRQAFMVVQFDELTSFDPGPLGRDDEHELYVVLRTSHDLSKAIEVALMPLRGRCMNQLPLPSFARDAPQSWSIKHIGDPLRRLENARTVLARAERYRDVFASTVRQLTSVRVTGDDLQVVLKRVLPDRPKRDEQVVAIVKAFHDSPHVGFEGTGWGAVNAVGEYFEHGRTSGSRTDQARFTGGLDGVTRKYVARTAQLVLARA